MLLLLTGCALIPERSRVRVREGAYHYEGEITDELNGRLFALEAELAETPAPPSWLYITSRGGEVHAGLDLGEFVHRTGLGVAVPRYCLSSCANYVATAGRELRIHKRAIIGFHGGAFSPHFDTTGLDEYLADLPPEEREEALREIEEDWTEYISRWRARERLFFSSIGVSPAITTLGQQIELEGVHGYEGWRFSAEGLRRFGVENVTVVDPPWEPRWWRRKKFHLIRDELIPEEMIEDIPPDS